MRPPPTTSGSQILVNAMPAYCSAMVTASSHGGAFGGTYTATFGAFSSGTASAFAPSISPRIAVTRASSTGSTPTPASAASRRSAGPSGTRNDPPR